MPSGDPRKQPRPDGRDEQQLIDQMTQTFPPSLSGVVTEVAATVVPFSFVGGKAIDLQVSCGPLDIHLHFHPEHAEAIIDELRAAKIKADTGLQAASMTDVAQAAMKANGNGA